MASLVFRVGVCGQAFSLSPTFPPVPVPYWAVQWSWFAQVNALCNLSRKKPREVAVPLPGRFLSRHCFTLCITMEVEPTIVKQYKYHHCCSCKNYWGKGMEGGKSVFASFFGWPEDHDFEGKNHFGASCWEVQWSWFAWVNARYNLSHKKLQEVRGSLPGQFLSRHCFMLWITVEVEPRIAKQYKCHHCCSCKNYRGKGMEGGKKAFKN